MMEAVVSRLENHEAIPSAGNLKGGFPLAGKPRRRRLYLRDISRRNGKHNGKARP